MNTLDLIRGAGRAFLAVALLATSSAALAAATIVIVNNDGAGEGFNDPTPVAPVGGNAGTTLGQQRLNAFAHAANVWGATLTSVPAIRILSNFDPLTCTATGAVLGSAGARFIVRDFTGAGVAGTWYGEALGNKQAVADLVPNEPEIAARFNSNLGQPGCLTGSPFYYGLDNNVPVGQVNLVAVLLHEFAHGLGFQTFTSGTTGNYQAGFPSIYDHFVFDNTAGKLWTQMSSGERVASAINPRQVVWTGANVSAAVPGVLAQGTPRLQVTGSIAQANGEYLVGAASFGPQLGAIPVVGQIMPVVDQADGTGLACNALNALNALAVNGNIALVDRGVCGFAVKAKNAQDAGAIGVIVVDNVAGSPPPGMGGADPTVTIPAVRVTLADGNTIRAALAFRSRTSSGVIGNLGVNVGQRAGADPLGRVMLFTPNPFQGGSSVSHWDTSTFPNQLMEPSINADLTQSVMPPADLTYPMLRDIGW